VERQPKSPKMNKTNNSKANNWNKQIKTIDSEADCSNSRKFPSADYRPGREK
jgi:hypothetical protein